MAIHSPVVTLVSRATRLVVQPNTIQHCTITLQAKEKTFPIPDDTFLPMDGVVRSLEVRTKRRIFMRPVARLVDLEELNVPQGGEDVSVVPPQTD